MLPVPPPVIAEKPLSPPAPAKLVTVKSPTVRALDVVAPTLAISSMPGLSVKSA